jgi:hypothetical protein
MTNDSGSAHFVGVFSGAPSVLGLYILWTLIYNIKGIVSRKFAMLLLVPLES